MSALFDRNLLDCTENTNDIFNILLDYINVLKSITFLSLKLYICTDIYKHNLLNNILYILRLTFKILMQHMYNQNLATMQTQVLGGGVHYVMSSRMSENVTLLTPGRK